MTPAACRNSLDGESISYQLHRTYRALHSSTEAHSGNVATCRRGVDRPLEGTGTPDLDYAVNALAPGELSHRVVPLRFAQIVDHRVRAEQSQTIGLAISRRHRDYARTGRLAELQGEDRNAARSLHQERFTGLQAASTYERGPCGNARATETGGFLVRQILGHSHDAVAREDRLFRQCAVKR